MPKHILAIDADAAILDLYDQLLTEEGYTVLLCEEAEIAYQQARETMPDAIILEPCLSNRETGWRLLDLLAHDPRLHATPVLLCSSDVLALATRRDEVIGRGGAVLSKPFDIAALLTLLTGLLGNADTTQPARVS